jgi:hypothetical protein
MNRSMTSILGLAALVCVGAGAIMAEDAPGVVAPSPASKGARVEAGVDAHFDSRIDTWAEGVIVKLDAAGSKFAIAGHKLPCASVHAAMLNDIASKTASMELSLRPAKAAEIRLSWQGKLAKASAEELGKDSELAYKVPTVGELLVQSEDGLPNLDFLHHENGMASTPANPSAAVLGAPLPLPRNDQETAKVDVSKSTDEKQVVALGAFGKLTIGQPIYVGYASGTMNDEVYAVITRTTLQPTQPGKK